MSDQDLILDAVEDAQRILAEYLEPSSRWNPDATISMNDRREGNCTDELL